jgi:hypothetical protein
MAARGDGSVLAAVMKLLHVELLLLVLLVLLPLLPLLPLLLICKHAQGTGDALAHPEFLTWVQLGMVGAWQGVRDGCARLLLQLLCAACVRWGSSRRYCSRSRAGEVWWQGRAAAAASRLCRRPALAGACHEQCSRGKGWGGRLKENGKEEVDE